MAATETATRWHIKGDYFENCNCDVACPCLFSANAPLASSPTEGPCEVPIVFHIDEGHFGETSLDGLNAALAVRTPGVMGEGNGTLAVYLDERADSDQQDALTAIFTGSSGGPMAAFAPLIGEVLGVKPAAITFTKDGHRRSAEIAGIAHLSVRPVQSALGEEPLWVSNAHPFAPTGLALAVGEEGSTWSDYEMSWDNSGKNGHFAAIEWSNG